MLIVLNSFHADTAMIAFGLLVAGSLIVAWRTDAAAGAVGAAAALVFVVFAEWAIRGNLDMLVLPGGPLPGIGPSATDGSVSLHLISAAIFAAGFGLAGFLAQGRSSSPIIPVIWSAAAVFTPLALLVALYARIAHLDRSIPFAILAVILAAAYAAATEILSKREERPGGPAAIALFATGALAALALALTFALEKGWLTIALALMSLGTAWISMQRPIPFLRTLAAILAGIVVLRIGYEPRIVGDAVGTTPIFNWLLWGYGIPAASFWAAGIFLRRGGDDAPLRAVESAAILFTVLLAFMEIRHAVNNGDVYRQSAGLTEVALQVCVALAMAIGLERLRIRTGSFVHTAAAGLLTVFAGIAAVFGLLGLENPVLWPIDVGGGFINLLLLGYALPAVLALLLSYAVAGPRPVGVRQYDRGGRADPGAYLCDVRDPSDLSRPGHVGRTDHRRRAIHLFDRLALVRRGAARDRRSLQLAARAAGVGCGDCADDRKGLPDRRVDADGGLPRAVVHGPRAGAGGDRLAVPADPVPETSHGARGAGRSCRAGRRLILIDRFRDQADPEHRLPGLVEQFHLPFGIRLQAARNAAEQVAADLGHLGPGRFAALEFGALVGRTGVATVADPEKILRHDRSHVRTRPRP